MSSSLAYFLYSSMIMLIFILFKQCVKLFSSSPTRKANKLKCLSLTSLSSLVLCLQARPGAYPRGEYLKGAPLGQALDKLSWKSFAGTNSLAYFTSQFARKKKFYNINAWSYCY
jgi:hypothetical protein